MKEYIEIGKLNKKIFNKIDEKLVTEDVIFTYERVNHVETRRAKLYEEMKNFLPEAIYNPDRIYRDWNNRDNTLVLIKNIDQKSNLNIVLKIAVENDEKHQKTLLLHL